MLLSRAVKAQLFGSRCLDLFLHGIREADISSWPFLSADDFDLSKTENLSEAEMMKMGLGAVEPQGKTMGEDSKGGEAGQGWAVLPYRLELLKITIRNHEMMK